MRAPGVRRGSPSPAVCERRSGMHSTHRYRGSWVLLAPYRKVGSCWSSVSSPLVGFTPCPKARVPCPHRARRRHARTAYRGRTGAENVRRIRPGSTHSDARPGTGREGTSRPDDGAYTPSTGPPTTGGHRLPGRRGVRLGWVLGVVCGGCGAARWLDPCGVWGGSRRAGVWLVLGGVLLSRTLAGAVPSALGVLASGFGMGPGVGSPAVTTETLCGVVCACCVPSWWHACVRVGGGLVLRTAWWTRAFLGVCVVVCCLCRPISTGRLAGPCGSSTSGLSTQWSAGGLPPPWGGVDTLS